MSATRRLSTHLPMSYLDDPFASTLHRAAQRSYRRARYPKGLSVPSWFAELSSISE